MYPVLVLLLAFFIYSAKTDLNYFETELAQINGPLQWLTIGTILFASIMCFYRAHILKPFRGGVFSACSIAAGFIFLIFALDEMSWGQIIFNYPTPELIKMRNAEGEMNIRHLVVWGFEIADIIFTLGIKILATLYFLILPFLYSRVEKLKVFVNRFSIPLPRYTQTGAYVITGLLVYYLIPVGARHFVFEFVFYWILVLMMYNPLNDEVFSRKSLIR